METINVFASVYLKLMFAVFTFQFRCESIACFLNEMFDMLFGLGFCLFIPIIFIFLFLLSLNYRFHFNCGRIEKSLVSIFVRFIIDTCLYPKHFH